MIYAYNGTFVQVHGIYKARVSPNPVMLTVYQCGFISCNTGATVVGTLIMGIPLLGTGSVWKSLSLPLVLL